MPETYTVAITPRLLACCYKVGLVVSRPSSRELGLFCFEYLVFPSLPLSLALALSTPQLRLQPVSTTAASSSHGVRSCSRTGFGRSGELGHG